MIEWILMLFSFGPADATQEDYIGMLAAEAAYAAVAVDAAPVKPKIPTKDCTKCDGTGKVRTGDGLSWMPCPDCDPDLDGDSPARVIRINPSVLEIITEDELPSVLNSDEDK